MITEDDIKARVLEHEGFGFGALDEANIMMGFCGCGIPEENVLYILECLEAINRNAAYDEMPAICGSNKAYYFMLYWLSKEGLTEHGGGVGGSWLSEKGKNLMDALKFAKKYDEENGNV